MNLRSPAAWRALAAAVLVALSAPAGAARVAGQDFDERSSLAGADLLLNGVGVRAVAWFQGYAAALYLVHKVGTAQGALALQGPKRLQMKMLLEVPPKEFVKAIHKGMRRNHSPAEHAALQARIAIFDRNVEAIGTVKKGDVVNLDFVPGQGMVMSLNGRPRGQTIAGEDLYAAMLRIFIGDDPVDAKLKAGLLGQPPQQTE